jgi:hypothetical protein
MSFGVGWTDLEAMSLQQWFSTAKACAALNKKSNAAPPSDEDFDDTLDAIRALNLPDVKV